MEAEQALDSGQSDEPEILELRSVSGFILFDLPGAPSSAGGTRLAPDVAVAEVALLARAMTYKFAALGAPVGGAKAGIVGDPADLAGRVELMSRARKSLRSSARAGFSPDRTWGRSRRISRPFARVGPLRAR